MWRVLLARKAEKQFDKLPAKAKARVSILIGQLARNPYQGKKLSGKLQDEYALRSWPYRILYTIHKKELVILVVKVEHRQGAYK